MFNIQQSFLLDYWSLLLDEEEEESDEESGKDWDELEEEAAIG